MKVKLLREILLNPSDITATRSGESVEMDDERARDLAARGVVEFPGSKKFSDEAAKQAEQVSDNTVLSTATGASNTPARGRAKTK